MDFSSDSLVPDGFTSLAKTIFLIFLVVLPMVSYTVYAERRVSALIQDRLGPNRTGFPISLLGFKKDFSPFLGGLGQPIADAVKFLLKEDFVPAHVNKLYFWLAPCLAMIPAIVTLAAIPFGSELFGVKMVIADINVGLLFIFAISSVGVYGIVLAGWSSNSKYPFLGGIRSSSQMISYELGHRPERRSRAAHLLGSTSLTQIVDYQVAHGWLLAPFTDGGLNLRELLLWIPVCHLVRHLHHLDVRGDEPPAVRSARIGDRTRRRLSHGIFVDEVRALLPRRIHRDDRRLSALIVVLFLGGWHRRPSSPRPVSQRLGLGPGATSTRLLRQGRRAALRLHLGALDAAALPLRPADEDSAGSSSSRSRS